MSIYSCTNKDNGYIEKGHPSVINLSDSANNVKYFSVADNIRGLAVVNLETSEKSIISEAWGIERILKNNNKFFILDGKYMSIKVFDTSGKFLFNIGKLGKGEGEFVRIEDMQYYSPHNSLLVLCNSPAKIIEFTLEGQVIKETPINFYATAFAFQSPNSCIFYVNQNKSDVSGNKNIIITDSSFRVRERMLEMPNTLSSSVKFSGGIFSVNGDVYFNPAFSTVYYLSKEDTLLPAFKVDYGSRKIPAETPEGYLMDNLKKYGFQYNSFVKTKDFVGFNYHSNTVSSVFYDINSRNIMTSNEKKDSLNLLFSNLMFQKGDTIISVLDLNRLSPFIVRNKENIRKRFPEFLQNIKIEDSTQNPVLLIYTLKSI